MNGSRARLGDPVGVLLREWLYDIDCGKLYVELLSLALLLPSMDDRSAAIDKRMRQNSESGTEEESVVYLKR